MYTDNRSIITLEIKGLIMNLTMGQDKSSTKSDKESPIIDTGEINTHIADRSDVFYWQTDRAIEPEDAGHIWSDRHRYFTDDELVEAVNTVIGDDQLAGIEKFNPDAQTNLGNVNSVRVAVLNSGKKVIIRCHPKAIKNGYFHVESIASKKAKSAGLVSYDTLAIHDYLGADDFAFQVIEMLPGTAIKSWLEKHPDDESVLLPQIGMTMARLHKIKVDGFGSFDNERAKNGELIGLHQTFAEAVRAGLAFNLDVLTNESILTGEQSIAISRLFEDNNSLLSLSQGVLVHNDFADWNLLTDGKQITGILDWDECVGGDAVSDIACWSTFFEPDRLKAFLDGYWQIADKSSDFEKNSNSLGCDMYYLR